VRKEITGEMLAAISAEVVRLKAHHYGKGPTEAKTYVNDNFVFCVMKGGMTRVEETLISSGDESLVRQVRLRFQEQMHTVFRDAIEKITGCVVVGYQSQLIVNPDYMVEIFILGDEDDLIETSPA
jgi:uncharacterized protein YbcI